jgi:hypothetical protein
LHKSPSAQLEPLEAGTKSQPDAGLHASVVQTLPSSQVSGVPAWQVPAASHVSAPSQTSPSAQDVPGATGV